MFVCYYHSKPCDEIGEGMKQNGAEMARINPDKEEYRNGDMAHTERESRSPGEVLLAQSLDTSVDPEPVQPPNSQLTKRPTNIRFTQTSISKIEQTSTTTPFLREGESHCVKVPTKKGSFHGRQRTPSLKGESASKRLEKEDDGKEESDVNSLKRKGSLRRRQRTLLNRVRATQTVLKVSNEEILNKDETVTNKSAKHWSLLKASTMVSAKQKELEGAKSFFDVVTQYTAQASKEQSSPDKTSASPNGYGGKSEGRASGPKGRILTHKESKGAIPIADWKNYIKEGRQAHHSPAR